MNSWQSDIKPVIRGVQRVLQSLSGHQQEQFQQFWQNSSLKAAAYAVESRVSAKLQQPSSNDGESYQQPQPEPTATAATDASAYTVSNVTTSETNATPVHEDATAASISATEHKTKAMASDKLSQQQSRSQPEFKSATATGNSNVKQTVTSVQPPSPPAASYPQVPSNQDKIKSSDQRQFNKQALHVESQKLSDYSKERRVPASRVSRFMSFGGLAAGLGFGALAEVTKRGIGVSKPSDSGSSSSLLGGSALLSEANAERIVNTLCRVRGAALKLGQMLSIQDASLIDPRLQMIFERVRQSADFMPRSQMERMMRGELGDDWRSKFATFEDQPFAAASIGEVHRATLHDGRSVAVKIQYPGVAKSIESDINNLMSILKFWNVLPEGLHLDATARVAKKELAWECDYIREAKSAERFRSIFEGDSAFYVPEIVWPLTTKQVLTMEFVDGVTVDKLVTADSDTRNWVSRHILRLCLHELFIANFMQTDPNWSNFLYDPVKQKIMLLDFGASREYDMAFVKPYMQLIKAASIGNKEDVLKYSQVLGFLTGFESKVMEKAHIDAVLILGEPFAYDGQFNFATQTTAARIHQLIRVMLRHRLAPPPEEAYSLHRKMAGCFLLCAKLQSSFVCKPLFDEVYDQFTRLHGNEVQVSDVRVPGGDAAAVNK